MAWNHYRNRHVEIPMGLAEAGNECIFVNPVKYKNWENGSMRLHNISSHPSNSVKVIDHFTKMPLSPLLIIYENYENVRMVKRYKPDAVVSWDPYMSLFICIYCKWKHIPFIFDAMDDWGEMGKNYFIRFYFKCFVNPVLKRLSYAVTSTSHRQAEVYGKYNKRVYLIPNGKPMDFIKKAGEYASLNSISYKSNVVNFIATLRDWYDFDLLFEVFREFPELQLNLYGKGELYDYLKEKSSGYPNIAIKGHADSEILPKLTDESLFGILPLKFTKLNESTCPIKLFDYWSAKKAVIASPTYEMKKMAQNGGIILARTKEDYIHAIKSLLSDVVLRESIGNKGYENMITKYNYNIIIKQFTDSLALGN